MSFYDPYDELLTREEAALVAKAEGFCEGAFAAELLLAFREGRPYAASWIKAWADAGFLGLQTHKEHGGHGASFLCKIRVAQAMAEHGFGAAFAINNLQSAITRLSRAGSDEQRRQMLQAMMTGAVLSAPAMTEPAGGSDLSALTTTATPVEGGWVINGAKDWVTNGMVVGCVTLLARVQTPDGAREIVSFLAQLGDASSVQREEIDVPGAKAFRLARLTFKDHFVPAWALFSEPGQALKSSLASINAARVHVAAMCVASLRAALREAVQYSSTRKAFGKTLVEHQGLRWELAEVAVRLEAANSLVFRAARAVNDGKAALTLAAQAKKFAVDTSIWGIDQCIRAVGAVGASGGHRLNMLFAEVRMSAYADGTSEMLLDRIGKNLAGEYGEVPQSP
jgi:alkylation response protein AidB-like acyl-CoA dehydrogenase